MLKSLLSCLKHGGNPPIGVNKAKSMSSLMMLQFYYNMLSYLLLNKKLMLRDIINSITITCYVSSQDE